MLGEEEHISTRNEASPTRRTIGRPRSKFRLIDRRCRQFVPNAQDLLARAKACRELGLIDSAARDIDRAARIDPTDPDVLGALLEWGSESARDEAAKRLLAEGRASDLQVKAAVEWLMRRHTALAYRLSYVDGKRVLGSVVWTAGRTLRVEIDWADGQQAFEIAPDPTHRWRALGPTADFDCSADGEIFETRLLLDGHIRFRLPNFQASSPRMASPATTAEANAADHVLVVVPVYADLEATQACLGSLARQSASIAIRAVIVDDASPDADLQAYLGSACRKFGFTLLRNSRNLGFVGAANRGLLHHDGGDILFLNADTVLPDGAIERLRRAVYSRENVGTATPFSNNGEFTSFPAPGHANPMPEPEALAAVDRAFSHANDAVTIALPSGVGFCLYVKQRCFEAVGAFSRLYAPGYGEDTEFCLIARARGFVNVCAADVYVGHSGSRSFRAAKRALVMRNLRILEERFPDFRSECAAFLHADPLRGARSRAEQILPPKTPTRLLLVGAPAYVGAASARSRGMRATEPGRTVLFLRFPEFQDAIEVRASDLTSPQTLIFAQPERERADALRSYLGGCNIDRIELFGASELSEEIFGLIASLGIPIDIVCADAWPLVPPLSRRDGVCANADSDEPCEECRNQSDLSVDAKDRFRKTLGALKQLLGPDSRVLPVDPLASAFAPFAYGRLPKAEFAQEPTRENAALRFGSSLAVLAPVATTAVDAFLKRFGREVRAAGFEIEIVVFGACLDDEGVMSSGAIFVAGPTHPSEYEEMLETYEIGYLLSPYRNSHHWLFSGELSSLPKAYFDWSFGTALRRAGDLAMDPRICDAKSARRVISWLHPNGDAARAGTPRG